MGEGDVVGDDFKYSTGLTTAGKDLYKASLQKKK
jgi:hypothetical protein